MRIQLIMHNSKAKISRQTLRERERERKTEKKGEKVKEKEKEPNNNSKEKKRTKITTIVFITDFYQIQTDTFNDKCFRPSFFLILYH